MENLKSLIKQEQRFIHRLYRHSIKSANPDPQNIWYRKSLISNNGRFAIQNFKFKETKS